MSTKTEQATSGLEGVVVAETILSEVDGERGRLIIAGHDVEQLAGKRSFEEACGLLWRVESREEIQKALGRARVEAWERLPRGSLELADGMDSLRASVAQLTAAGGGEGSENSNRLELAQPPPANLAEGAALVGAVAVYAAAWARRRAGQAPVAPDPSLPHAADYLRMVKGSPGPQAAVDALEAYLVTVMDHGMNASTFAARVVASTGSDAVSAIVAAIGALKGPLHGGAPGPVLDMLDAIGNPDRAAAWLEAELVAGRRIMGMGHRIYRVRDPRAAVLEAAVERLERSGVSTGRLALARAVEKAAEGVLRARHPNRPLRANVEFYTAVLLDSVGLPRTLFSPTFAVGRVVGWYAHVDEQRRTGRLIRPASRYVGKWPEAAAS